MADHSIVANHNDHRTQSHDLQSHLRNDHLHQWHHCDLHRAGHSSNRFHARGRQHHRPPTSPSWLPLRLINTRFVTGTITIIQGGPITFNGIAPTIAPQGGVLWDIYLDAPT